MDLLFQDTICAVSTAPGVGGIAVIRVSGKEALRICAPFFKSDISAIPANSCRFARFIRPEGEVLDEVMLTVFRAPHSFTGEDTLEIACHGSLYIQQCILQDLVRGGARLAPAGEGTQRAFLNGKMDLSQAEAVADLIASNSRAAHRLALKQMRGGYSDELARLRGKLLDFTSLVELELDFADHEELEFADRSQLQSLAQEIEEKIARLCDSFSVGNAIKNGIPVAIVGRTNAGKSTLLNALVGEEKAIVSDIHGTTRDVIEDCVSIDGILFRFFDTAGLRETNDTIESLGIARSYRAIDKAQIVLWVIDATELNDVSLDASPLDDSTSTASSSAATEGAAASSPADSPLTADASSQSSHTDSSSANASLTAETSSQSSHTDSSSANASLTAETNSQSSHTESSCAASSCADSSSGTASQSIIDDTKIVVPDEISVPDDKQLIIVLNKIDKIGNRAIAEDATNPSISDPAAIPETAKVTASRTQGPKRRICRISAKQGLGIDELRQMLIEASQIDEQAFEDVTVSNSRHYENLLHALDAIRRVQDGLSIGLSGDLLSMDLRECIDQLGAITGGALATDEILGNIFSKFCIGK